MGVTVIPGFLVYSEREFKERLEKFIGLTHHIHIDAMDGRFVPNTTWSDAGMIARLMPDDMTYELHLMVQDPFPHIVAHDGKHLRRYIFHVESSGGEQRFIDEGKKRKKEVYLAINPKTPIEQVTTHCAVIDGVMIIGNDPGFSGRPLLREKTGERLRALHAICPHVQRSVDIGVNAETAPFLREAGATELISTSYLTSTPDIAHAIKIIAG